ncbi:MAG: S1 RNA-binding domain-containing protein [Clostridiaceae bacterium]|nr:S1 RNA-binding domain-containing protein [Clostridiaceae bacterium]
MAEEYGLVNDQQEENNVQAIEETAEQTDSVVENAIEQEQSAEDIEQSILDETDQNNVADMTEDAESEEEVAEVESESEIDAEVVEVKADDEIETVIEATEAEESEQVVESAEPITIEDVEAVVDTVEQEIPLKDDGDIDFENFIDNIPELKRGMTVTGTLTSYDDDFVYVDVGDKSEGKVKIHEFRGDPDFDIDKACMERQTVEVYVRKIRMTDTGKEIELSKAQVDFNKHKDVVEKAFKDKTPLTVKVNNVVRDGVIASFGSVDMYIHRTQLELQIVEDLTPYLNQELDVLVTQYDDTKRRLRVSASRRSLIQRERREKAKQFWETIEEGKEYEGVVRNLTDFGAFVDIGGVDGLVHISELSWERIDKPSDVVSVGDHILVRVLDFDKDKNRVSLGFKRPENDPYRDLENRFPVGSIVRGVVVRMFPFGAFVEIAPGVDALCHISQISDYRLNRPEDVLQEGMEIDARVLDVSNEERKISISIREVEPINPENVEDLQQQATAKPRKRRPRRDENKQRQQSQVDDRQSDSTTAYTDVPAGGSTLSAVADIIYTDNSEPVVEDEIEAVEITETTIDSFEEKAEEVTEADVADEAEAEAVIATDAIEVADETGEEVAEAEVADDAEVDAEAVIDTEVTEVVEETTETNEKLEEPSVEEEVVE